MFVFFVFYLEVFCPLQECLCGTGVGGIVKGHMWIRTSVTLLALEEAVHSYCPRPVSFQSQVPGLGEILEAGPSPEPLKSSLADITPTSMRFNNSPLPFPGPLSWALNPAFSGRAEPILGPPSFELPSPPPRLLFFILNQQHLISNAST